MPLQVVEEDPAFAELLAPPRRQTVPHRPSDESDIFLYGELDSLAYQRQLNLEEQTVETAVKRFQRLSADAAARGDIWTHRPASRLVGTWVDPVTLAIRKVQEAVKKDEDGGRASIEYESDRLLQLLSPEAIAVILIHNVFGALIREPLGAKLTSLAVSVGNAVRAEINQQKIHDLELKQRAWERKAAETAHDNEPLDSIGDGKTARQPRKRKRKKSSLQHALTSNMSIVSAVNLAAMQADIPGTLWSTRDTLLIGTRLIDILIKSTFVQDEKTRKIVPAFKHYRRFLKKNNVVGMVQLEDAALKLISHERNDVSSFIEPKYQPMEVRPRPWVSPKNGAYLRSKVDLIRAPPSHALDNALAAADLQTLYEGLNALGDTSWRVNRGVLDAGQELWNRGGGKAGLVSKFDVTVPTRSAFLAKEETAFLLEQEKDEDETSGQCSSFDEANAIRKYRRIRKAAKKTNRELFSLRADTQYRLDYATAFADKEPFYLPHNVDFRGRAYPIPVYLQHMGADLTRAMLAFSNPGVQLGERGVYWLKIHLANKLGADKMSFDERIDVAENALPKAIQVGRNPLQESNLEWWNSHEDPFQLLAVCQELADAVGRYGGEQAMEGFYSTLPVAMDGSCNGLQHYAALGRDVLGGKQVNLIRSDRPQDVYTAVSELVSERVDLAAGKGDEIAKLLVGKVTRKVIKQTVMTSVYGVTLTGAREQIGSRLKDIDFPSEHIFAASLMLSKMTLSSLGDIFAGATKTMDWLSNAAHAVASAGHEVQWVTPVGLPVVQPYRKRARSIVKTIMQRVTLEQQGDHTPVSSQRQRSAFPPNFVHSIDSSHMLLTSIACKNVGLNFAAVHDSFWTNAATVDVMNEVLREEFVKLHSRELLREVREGFVMRHPHIKFEEVPERGSLQLEEVLDSPYFFS